MDERSIQTITLTKVTLPLKRPFQTAKQTIKMRSIILVSVATQTQIGWGECVSFETPWYHPETLEDSWNYLIDHLIPWVKAQTKSVTPYDIYQHFLTHNHTHPFAHSALEQALWDLQAKLENIPLYVLLAQNTGPDNTPLTAHVPSGIVLGDISLSDKTHQIITRAQQQQIKRIKVKLSPKTSLDTLYHLCSTYPHLFWVADANGSLNNQPLSWWQELNHIPLNALEQPYSVDDIHQLEALKAYCNLNIALDEQITSLEELITLHQQVPFDMAVFKPSRLGGTLATLQCVNYATAHHIPFWFGGMIESGISKAHNLSLASSINTTQRLPSEFSPSDYFWQKDIINPKLQLQQGNLILPEKPGIGVTPDLALIKHYQQNQYKVTLHF